jgi:uncharacterized protein (DUF58 family)
MSNDPLLLEEAIRRKLDQLTLVASKVRSGAVKGDRRSKKRGSSVEFADYRNYAPGDDLRRMDWNIYARLERPYIKLLEDEEDLAVHLILDASASMNWPPDGDPSHHKFTYGRRLFAGLAYIALGSNDRVTMTALSGAALSGAETAQSFGPSRGRQFGLPMLRYAHALKSGGVTDLNNTLRDYAMRAARPGLCFVISDFFSPTGYLDGVNALLGRGYEVVALHVLSPDEVEPPLTGDLRLVDVETGLAQEVSVDGAMRALYMRRVAEWRESLRADCARRGVQFLPLVTDQPWERVLLYDLRRLNLVK